MSIIERSRLARELHDGIAQDLVAVGYSLDLLLAAPQTPLETRIHLRTLRFTVAEMIDKVRKEIHHLHQPADLDLNSQIRSAAEETCKDLNLTISIENIPLPPSSDFAYHIGRIAHELLRNISSHAQARSAWVSLTNIDGVIELVVSDDGIGGAEVSAEHFGIQGIYSRAESLGGVFTMESTSLGTKMRLRIPIG